MALTYDDLKVLGKPFRFDQHEFLRGNVYLREGAVMDRLESVDPSLSIVSRDSVNEVIIQGNDVHIQVSVTVDITLKGVTRSGIGTSNVIFTTKTDNKTGVVTKESISNEAVKSAFTDGLKRAARLFRVGRYLLDAPRENQFNRWLAQLSDAPTPRKPAPMTQDGNAIVRRAKTITAKNDKGFRVVTFTDPNVRVNSFSFEKDFESVVSRDSLKNVGNGIFEFTQNIDVTLIRKGKYWSIESVVIA